MSAILRPRCTDVPHNRIVVLHQKDPRAEARNTIREWGEALRRAVLPADADEETAAMLTDLRAGYARAQKSPEIGIEAWQMLAVLNMVPTEPAPAPVPAPVPATEPEADSEHE